MEVLLKKSIIGMIGVLCFVLTGFSDISAQVKQPIQSSTARGEYIANLPINFKELSKLPIPSSNENYAFLQSIDSVTNVVIGRFIDNKRTIVLVQDKNSDGVVDFAVECDVEAGKFKYSPNPARDFPKDKFQKMKQDIINGVQGELSPNREAANYIKVLQKDSQKVKRWKNGYRVFLLDSDDDTLERLNFFFSTGAEGADLVFEVKYRNEGVARITPIIRNSVYCRDSKDKFIIDETRKLIEEAARYMPVSE
jgi:hypothetical protein